MNTTQQVSLSSIDIPESFRQHTMESVDALAQDIQRNGQIQEIVVTPKGEGRYELVAGKRRTLAMRHLNWENARAQVMENLSELQKALIMIAENDEREDVNPFDRALSYQRALKAGATKQELAQKLGISEEMVRQILSITQLSPEVTEKTRRLGFSGAKLYELARLLDAPSQLKMADACDKGGWSSKVLRDKVSRVLAAKSTNGNDVSKTVDEPEPAVLCKQKGKKFVIVTQLIPDSPSLDLYMQDIRNALADYLAELQQVKEVAAIRQAA